jgi:hypothetical protein
MFKAVKKASSTKNLTLYSSSWLDIMLPIKGVTEEAFRTWEVFSKAEGKPTRPLRITAHEICGTEVRLRLETQFTNTFNKVCIKTATIEYTVPVV